MTADKIAAARALIEPLTGYSSGPWEVVTDLPAIAIAAGEYRVVQTPNQNNYRHFGPSERWLGIESFSNAALIAAAPALRDTVADLADLTDALAQENAKLREALQPFSDAADIKLCGEWQDHQSVSRTDTAFHITFGHLRAARAALGETP